MKKIICAVLSCLFLLNCAACGSQPGYDDSLGDAPLSGGSEELPDNREENLNTVISIPDLEHYFGVQNVSERELTEVFRFDADPREAARSYVQLLEEQYDIVLAESYEDDAVAEWVMHHKDNTDAPFSIAADRAGDGTWEINCRLNAYIFQFDGEVWAWPNEDTSEPEPEPEPAPESQPTESDPAVLPDFLEHDTSGKFYLSDSHIGKVVYKAKATDIEDAVKHYVELLEDCGYTVVYDEEKIYTGSAAGAYLVWDLYHADVAADAVGGDSDGQVKMILNTYEKRNTATFSVEFSDGITMENFSGVSGGNSSSVGSSNSGGNNNTRTPCSICNRTGDCQTCGGDGYLWSSAADKENRNCYSCRNHNGKCTNCNGKGWLD